MSSSPSAASENARIYTADAAESAEQKSPSASPSANRSLSHLVVITGSSSGIGKATAKAFSAAGYSLLLVDRNENAETSELPNTMFRQVNVVTQVDEFAEAIREAEAKFGPVTAMIANAGIMQLGEVTAQDPKEWKNMIDVNLTGLLNSVKLVVSGMQSRQRGHIFTLGSVAGRNSYVEHAVYCMTKFGVHGFAETLRKEVAESGVKVTVIAPGVTDTNLLGHTTDQKILDNYAVFKKQLGKSLVPEDVAGAMLWAYNTPPHVCIREIDLAPVTQKP